MPQFSPPSVFAPSIGSNKHTNWEHGPVQPKNNEIRPFEPFRVKILSDENRKYCCHCKNILRFFFRFKPFDYFFPD